MSVSDGGLLNTESDFFGADSANLQRIISSSYTVSISWVERFIFLKQVLAIISLVSLVLSIALDLLISHMLNPMSIILAIKD